MHFIASRKFMFFIIVLMFIAQLFTVPAFAVKDDSSQICVYATQKYEKAFNIKPHLLTTISHVETGRYDKAQNITNTWPWTVNAKGKSMYFNTKKEAVNKVKELQKAGLKSIDVGCMQVNLLYHGDAFDSVEDAFDVDKNVYYAATFLTKLYKNADDCWDKAVMHYHSKRQSKGSRYKKKIDERYSLVKKLAKNKTYKSVPTKQASASKGDAWRQAKLEEYRKNKQQKDNI